MPLILRRWGGAAEFRARAEAFLLSAEAEHNLLFGVLAQIEEGDHGFQPPLYFATVEEEGAVVGCAFRTPPFELCLTRMPLAAVADLAADVGAVFETLPAVLGPPDAAARFAERWSERRGVSGRLAMRLRIHALERVVPPPRPPPGALSAAGPGDLPLLRDWAAVFAREGGISGGEMGARVAGLVARGGVYLWRDGEPRSMTAVTASTPHGARIGFVYTPPERRGRGYASACTAAASQRVLDSGKRFCFLYTDLANPTSNAIYRRIGYAPVCDVVEWDLPSEAR